MRRLKDITVALAGTIVRVALVILAAICIMKIAGKAYDFGYRIFAEEPMSAPPGRDINVVVTNGDSQSEIIQMLEDKGIIRDHMLFTIQKKLSLYKDDIKPGSYTLNTSMTTDEILEVIVGKEDDDDDGELEPAELSEEINPATDDVTGLETAGVLGEEGEYDESVAFEDDSQSDNGTEGEYEGEGDEESAIEE